MIYVLVVLCFLLDGILSNFLAFLPNALSLFTPYLTLVALILVFPLYRKNLAHYCYLAAILGFLYDLFYTNLLFTNAILFTTLALLVVFTSKYIQINAWTIPFFLCFFIGIYHLFLMFLLFLFHRLTPSFLDFFYLYSHSLLLNVLVGEILYLLLRKCHKKYAKACR